MDAKTEVIYKKTIQVAKSGGITHYSDIAPLVGLSMMLPPDRKTLADMLNHISESEHENGKPLLAAVVILKRNPVGVKKKIPGNGFFGMAQKVGLYNGGDPVEFWECELKRVHDCWREQ